MKRNILLFIMPLLAMSLYAQLPQLDTIPSERLLHRAFEYRNGINRRVNLAKAAAIYYHLCQRGNIDAMVPFGEMLFHGEGVEKDRHAAFGLFRRAAECGDTVAMCHIGDMYRQGIGVRQDFTKAAVYYRMAADKGSAQGCYGIGYLAYKGMGVKQDYAAAVRFLQQGADRNHPGCCFLLGMYYARGYDRAPDYQLSETFLERAARAGHGWTVDVEELSTIDSIMSWNGKAEAEWTHVGRHKIPSHGKMDLENNADLDSIQGRWEGSLYTYDWSGERIMKEEHVRVDVKRNFTQHIVTFSINDSLVSVFRPTWLGDRWAMAKGDIDRDNSWFVTSAKLLLQEDSTLMVDIKSRNTASREVRRPMTAVMEKVTTSYRLEPVFSIYGVNPGIVTNGQFTVRIDAAYSLDVMVALFNTSGVMVENLGRHRIAKGRNDISFRSSHTPGLYILRVSSGSETKSINLYFAQ